MKNLIILFAILLSMPAQAQSPDTVNNEFIYAELLGYQKFMSSKITLFVDFGQQREYFKDQRIRDEESGKIASFNSMVDAMNYMGADGWEFVQAYVVTMGSGSMAQNVYHWLMKKKKIPDGDPNR